LLAPDIIETVLEGRPDQVLMLEELQRPLPMSWEGSVWRSCVSAR
jgi:hypothetical protein